MIRPPRTLHVDRDALPSRDRARSLEEALSRLVADEYGTVVLHTRTPGRDDYDLVSYLAGTWPHFLRSITLRSVCGATAHVWNLAAGRFERESPAPARMRRPRQGQGADERAQAAG
jgi:hypothetical protein